MKDQSEGERCLDRNIGIDCLPTSFPSLRSNPCVDGLLTQPQSDVTPIPQRLIILWPVLDAISGFVFRMSIGAFMGFGHGDHRWPSGFVLDPT